MLLLHDDCAHCRTWVQRDLHTIEQAVARWGGRVERLETDFRANDAGDAFAAVVDEWEEVFHVVRIGAHHAFPDPVDLLEWVRFVAIQCPECEGPEGPWRL